MSSASSLAPTRGFAAAVFLASLAILLLQISLTRLLSVVLWYHFAFVAISLAMLGLALSGVALYLFPALLKSTPRLLPWYCRLAGITSVAATVYVMAFPQSATGVGLLSWDIAALYLCLLVPFTFAGLAVSAILAFDVGNIARLYSRDLLGAGLGCVIAVPLIDTVGAPNALLAASVALIGAATAVRRGWVLVDVLLMFGIAGLGAANHVTGFLEPNAMHGIPDSDASRGVVRDYAAWNSHSRVVVSSVAEGIKSINIDGHATTGIYHLDGPITSELLRRHIPWMSLRSGSMPYVALGDSPSVFLIGPGGGLDILNGIFYGADITGVELNGLIHGLMSDGPIAKWAGDVYKAPGVQVFHDEARSWLRRSSRRFDLIQASMIDTWAATAGGAFALAENSLYTVEAFQDYRNHLTERGMVHFMRWHEDPPRQSLRLISLILEAMRRAGVPHPYRHVIALEEPQFPDQGAKMVSVLWSKQPFAAEALTRVQAAVDERSKIAPVRFLCWPTSPQDNILSKLLRAEDPGAVIADYDFEVTATTDDRPFFFHTKSLTGALKKSTGAENEDAVRVLGSVLITVLAICVLAFLAPLAFALTRGRIDTTTALPRLSYFCCIGVGFMLVEIPMLQRMSLYIGHPTWTLSAVLAALLLGAGWGGARTSLVTSESLPKALFRSLLGILVVLVAMTLLVPFVTDATMSWPFALRMVVTFSCMAVLGAFLGRALPLGMRALTGATASLTPWAWGLNGVASVLASVLAVVLAIEIGFTATLFIGVAAYAFAAILCHRFSAQSL